MDLIDRQAAIDAMGSISDSICEQQAVDALWELPSAQPERKKGKWIIAEDIPRLDNTYTIQCSECGQLMFAHPNEKTPNFCCNCGADMGGR